MCVAFVTADLLRDLKRQFGAYKTFCLAEKNDDQRRDDVPNVRLWWKAKKDVTPISAWVKLARFILSLLPSSAMAERIFSRIPLETGNSPP